MRTFDCAVIGTGPSGQKAAIQAAKLGKRVVIIEKQRSVGGAAINTGTIPSKALREAVLHLTGASKRGLFGEAHRVKRDITLADLTYVSQQVIHHEVDLTRGHFARNNIEVVNGAARFLSPDTLHVDLADGGTEQIKAANIILAVGSRPALPEGVKIDEKTIFTSDGLLTMECLPHSLIVVGGGVIGVEYACMMSTLGVKVTLVEARKEVLGFLDHEIVEAFQYHMRQGGMTLRLGERVASIENLDPTRDHCHPDAPSAADRERAAMLKADGKASGIKAPGTRSPDIQVPDIQVPDIQVPAARAADAPAVDLEGDVTTKPEGAKSSPGPTPAYGRDENGPHRPQVMAVLESGKVLRAEALLYSVGRQGNTDSLDLEKAGLTADKRGRLTVNEHFQTDSSHVYAVGDVVGFPALASTAMEQGRMAVCHAFGVPIHTMAETIPFGVYAIPEISMVGQTEEQLTEAGIPYEAGIAQYKEVARGQLLGDDTGMLKLLIHQEDHTILGVHAIGTGATEIIHIGQAVMALKGKVEFFVHNVFNYPTLAEAYKVAALNGLNKLRHI